MNRIVLALACAALLAPAALFAQSAAPSPYQGQESRDIKALSPEDIRSLNAGEGMGFAKAAELNRYPGPAHVLQLADDLHLSAEQRAHIQQIFARMKEAAVSVGRDIIAKERELDQLFATSAAHAEEMERRVTEIARLQGHLRAIHLGAHLDTLPLLSPQQAHQYQVLRGYQEAPTGEQGGGHHGMHNGMH